MPTVQSFKAPKKLSSSASLLLEKRFCGLEYNLHVRYCYGIKINQKRFYNYFNQAFLTAKRMSKRPLLILKNVL